MDPGRNNQNFSNLIYDVNADAVFESDQGQARYPTKKFNVKFIKICSFITGIVTALLITLIVIISTSAHQYKKDVYTDKSTHLPKIPTSSVDLSGHLIVSTGNDLCIMNLMSNNNYIIQVNTSANIDLFDYDHNKKTLILMDKDAKEFKFFPEVYPIESFSRKLKPETFRVDHITGNLYLIDNDAGTVNVINITSGRGGILLSQISNPSDLVLDPSEGIMFIASEHQSISKADMNGHNLELIVNNSRVSALAIDFSLQNLYFALDFSSIDCVNYMGNSRVTITQVLTTITSLTILNQSLYWTGESTLWSCEIQKSIYGPSCEDITHLHIKNPRIARSYERQRVATQNPCNGDCQHLCLLAPDSHKSESALKYSCACAVGWELERDGKSCKLVVDYMLYALDNKIRARNLNANQQSFVDVIYPTEFHTESVELKHAIEFDYDMLHDRLYISDDHNIYMMNIKNDDSKQKRLVHVDADDYSIKDVAFDWLSGYLYFVKESMIDSLNHTIVALRYSDVRSIQKTIYIFPYTNHAGKGCPHSLIALPDANALFYTAYKGQFKDITMYSIVRDIEANLNGLPYVNKLRPLAIDYGASKLYIFVSNSADNHTISSMNYDASNEQFRFETQVPNLMSIYVYQQWVFISNEISIWRLDKTNGSGLVAMMQNSDSRILSKVRIVSPKIQSINAENPCASNNGGCKQFCFGTISADKQCRCSNATQNIYRYC